MTINDQTHKMESKCIDECGYLRLRFGYLFGISFCLWANRQRVMGTTVDQSICMNKQETTFGSSILIGRKTWRKITWPKFKASRDVSCQQAEEYSTPITITISIEESYMCGNAVKKPKKITLVFIPMLTRDQTVQFAR